MSNFLNIDENTIKAHGLSLTEYDEILNIMGRKPNLLELGIFSVMWSEHCSYKSSRLWLKTLPTTGDKVIQGPGENAGVVDIGDGLAAVFKIESHNHPSFIEPYQGAATGVGGILRDIFTMGARPIANLNALRFGDPSHPKTKDLLLGVVAGIAGYGNSIGVATIGGECGFDAGYNGNILVNAMTVGIAPKDKIFYSKAAGIGNSVIYVGAKTGRDGIHGATMASTEFSQDNEEKRPTVQVGDPFTEKRLLEACMELMKTDIIVAIQDMGAAGLTSSSVEMANKGGLGILLELDQVPMREQGMTPYELMLSESQERMLIVIHPDREEEAKRIFHKWELDFAVIGQLNNDGHIRLNWHGEEVGAIKLDPLVEKAPLYDRPYSIAPVPSRLEVPADYLEMRDIFADLTKLLSSPDICSKRWIYEQYDYLIGGGTFLPPGHDAGVIGLFPLKGEFPAEMIKDKALALSVDCTPRYCASDAKMGAAQAVMECWRNLTASGATPIAITNNLNYGNPERKAIMGQIVAGIEGIGMAASALSFPVISGNVSLYNETQGKAIPPTPVIGGVGLLDDFKKAVGIGLKAGQLIYQVGQRGEWFGQSLFARLLLGLDQGAPPPVDFALELKIGTFIREYIDKQIIIACHDVSNGGVLVALSKMAFAGKTGIELSCPKDSAFLFAEDQARYILAIDPKDQAILEAACKAQKIHLFALGKAEGERIGWNKDISIALSSAQASYENFLPDFIN